MIHRFFPPAIQAFVQRHRQIFWACGSLLLGLASTFIGSAFLQQQDGNSPAGTQPDRVYRVCKWITAPDGSRTESVKTPGMLGSELKSGAGQAIEMSARTMTWPEDVPVASFKQSIDIKRWVFADPSILQMFELDLVYGQAGIALERPGQVILSKRMAEKLFGSGNPVGKTLLGLGGKQYTVSGVVANANAASPLQFDLLASWASTQAAEAGFHAFPFLNNWTAQLAETFIRLQDPVRLPAVEQEIVRVAEASPNPSACSDLFLRPVSESGNKSSANGNPEQERYGAKSTTSGAKMVLMGGGFSL